MKVEKTGDRKVTEISKRFDEDGNEVEPIIREFGDRQILNDYESAKKALEAAESTDWIKYGEERIAERQKAFDAAALRKTTLNLTDKEWDDLKDKPAAGVIQPGTIILEE